MNSSTVLSTTFVAAVAMISTTTFGEEYNPEYSNSTNMTTYDGVEYSGYIYTLTGVGDLVSAGAWSYIDKNQGLQSSLAWGDSKGNNNPNDPKWFLGTATGNKHTLSTIRFNASSKTPASWNKDAFATDGIIVEADSTVDRIEAINGHFIFGKAGNVSRSTINNNFTFDFSKGVGASVRGIQEWTIAAEKIFAIDTGANATDFSEKTTIKGAGTAAFLGSGSFTMSAGASFEISDGGRLDLSEKTVLGSGSIYVVNGSVMIKEFGAGATVNIGASGTLSVGLPSNIANLTTSAGAILDLNGASSSSVGLTVTETTNLNAGTVFDLAFVAENILLISGSNLNASDFSVKNLMQDGVRLNHRGEAIFKVVNGVLTLTSYTAGANKTLTWNGGVNGTWVFQQGDWNDDVGAAEIFEAGDSVIFDTTGAVVTIEKIAESALFVKSIVIDEKTTFTGGGNIVADSLTVNSEMIWSGGVLAVESISGSGVIIASGVDGRGPGAVSVERFEIGAGGISGESSPMTPNTLELGTTTIAATENWENAVTRSIMLTSTDGAGTTFETQKADGTETSAIISSVVSGVGALTKTGSGTLTLTGTNTYAGGTTISEGTLVVGSNAALGTNSRVTISGGQLSINSGVKLNQTAIDIVLNDAYLSSAAIIGSGVLADGTKITLSGDVENGILSNATEIVTKTYQIFDVSSGATLLTGVNADSFILSEDWINAGWQISDFNAGVGTVTLTLTAVPEPSTFGLLAGLGALALVASRRRRSRKAA